MIFRFMRDQASFDGTAAVVIELGDNFVDWPTIYPVPASAAADNPGVTVVKDKPAGFDTVTLTLPMSGNTRRFLRIRLNPW